VKPKAYILSARGCEADIVAACVGTWRQFFDTIVIVTPEDDVYPGADTIFGQSEHHGERAMERTRWCIEKAMEYPCAAIGEPDLMFFGEIDVNQGELVCGWIFDNDNPDFSAPQFPHSPWCATRETFGRILDAMKRLTEPPFGDRVVAAACRATAVPMRAVGWSVNSIDSESKLQDAQDAIARGAKTVHGVKEWEVARSLLQPRRPLVPLGF